MMKKITVIGAGTMGNGIAHVFAQNGYNVNLSDISAEALQNAISTISANLDRQVKKEKCTEEEKNETLSRLTTSTDLAESCYNSNYVIEAVSENLKIKTSILTDVESLVDSNCIIGSNTSSISISLLAAQLKHQERFIGIHFMNPVPVMSLVEIIRGYNTTSETAESIVNLCQAIGKTPITVNDYPGFVANRILMPMINEAIITLQEGVAGVKEIDSIMQLGMAHPMGPLKLADFIGLDICLSIMNVLYQGLKQAKYAPSPLLEKMVISGHLGRKSGTGFYDWSTDPKNPDASRNFS